MQRGRGKQAKPMQQCNARLCHINKIQRNYLELHLVDKGSVDGYSEIWAKLFHEQTHLFVQNSYRMWDLLMTCMRILIPLFSACTCYFQNYNINICYLDGKEKAEYRGKGRTGKKQCSVVVEDYIIKSRHEWIHCNTILEESYPNIILCYLIPYNL